MEPVSIRPGYRHLIGSFWVGFALAIAFLEVWQIFWPVGMASFLILAAAGLGGWFISWKKVCAWLGSQNPLAALVFVACAGSVILFLSNIVIYSDLSPDFGLYHLQTVKWFTAYRLPPGLVNLHFRLAFNQAGFLLAAQLENGVLPGLAYYVTSPIIFGALLLQTASGVIFALRQPSEIRTIHLASAFLFFATLKYVGESQLAGYAPDRMIYVIEVVVGLAMIDLFDRSIPEEAPFHLRLIDTTLLIGLGVVLKLSFAAFGLAAMLAISGLILIGKGNRRVNLRAAIGVLALPGLLVIPWMVRGAILSGYPFFPSNLLSLPVTWRMPEKDAALMVSTVTDWARTCSNTMPLESGKFWMLTWKNCLPPEFWDILDLSGVLLAAALLLGIWRRRTGAPRPANSSALVLLGICLVALVYWLFVLPDYRFAGAAFWLLLLSCLLLLLNQVFAFFSPATNLKILTASGLIFLVWLSPNQHNFDLQKKTFFVPPPAMEIAKSHYPQGEIISHSLAGGGVVYSPSRDGNACWDAPLPCTQLNDVHPRLAMLDSHDLEHGFNIAPATDP